MPVRPVTPQQPQSWAKWSLWTRRGEVKWRENNGKCQCQILAEGAKTCTSAQINHHRHPTVALHICHHSPMRPVNRGRIAFTGRAFYYGFLGITHVQAVPNLNDGGITGTHWAHLVSQRSPTVCTFRLTLFACSAPGKS